MYTNSSTLIFTDLDGTLLNRDTFKFDSIKPFLIELKNKNIIIIPNSSKTEDEIIEFNNEANFQFPFISENGSIIHNLNFLNDEFPNKIILAKNIHEIQNIFDKNINQDLKSKCKVISSLTTSEPSLEIYDINSGKLLWKFILMKKNNKRYGGKRYDYSGGNPWGGFSLDKKRGIVYLTTGNAGKYFDGVNRPGKNNYANSILAFDIKNKKKLWDFQEVRHDIWNLDIPAPPILGSITKNKKKTDVVIAVTKLGNTIVLDRKSGEPMFDIHLKKAPKSLVPGEKTNFYQPSLKIPQPFAKQNFNLNEITNINENSKSYILNKIKDYNYGFFQPYEIGKKNVQFNFHGGAEWPGGSFDLKKEYLYITSSNIAWEAELTLKPKKKFRPPTYYVYNSKFKRLKDENGYPGSKPPWGTITAINLKNGLIVWQVPFGEYENLTKKNIPLTGTENYSGLTGTEAGILLATGTLDKKFRIFDSENGKELWSYELPFIGSSPPITYLVDGEQYILINATGSVSLKKGYPDLVEFGNSIIVFKLMK